MANCTAYDRPHNLNLHSGTYGVNIACELGRSKNQAMEEGNEHKSDRPDDMVHESPR